MSGRVVSPVLVGRGAELAVLEEAFGRTPSTVVLLASAAVGNGLVSGPVHTLLLQATPAGMTATSGGVSALFRTLGLSIGPATGALSWTLTGGGIPGFRNGVTAIAVATVAGIAATAAMRSSVGHRGRPEPSVLSTTSANRERS